MKKKMMRIFCVILLLVIVLCNICYADWITTSKGTNANGQENEPNYWIPVLVGVGIVIVVTASISIYFKMHENGEKFEESSEEEKENKDV